MPRVDSHCCLDSKRHPLLDKINTLAYGIKDIKQQLYWSKFCISWHNPQLLMDKASLGTVAKVIDTLV